MQNATKLSLFSSGASGDRRRDSPAPPPGPGRRRRVDDTQEENIRNKKNILQIPPPPSHRRVTAGGRRRDASVVLTVVLKRQKDRDTRLESGRTGSEQNQTLVRPVASQGHVLILHRIWRKSLPQALVLNRIGTSSENRFKPVQPLTSC